MSAISKQISILQHKTDSIRNICILAHIDHGKTTLSDSLISSNGIISSKLAGKVRYLDSRDDEQQRGITMKSSAISLRFTSGEPPKDYLINLIDSPGHVDFSSEVSSAVRLTDGALVLIDVIEGVSSQTTTVLRQAWVENIKPCLVLNKIDRLITEWKMSPTEAYHHLQKLLEQANAVMGTLFSASRAEEVNKTFETSDSQASDWNFDDIDDADIYFAPEKGNVMFSSATDGWGFRVSQFAKIYSKKLGIKEEMLNKTLWGNYYIDTKAKKVVNGKHGHGKLKPMFVQFVLENIWAIYDSTVLNHNAEKIEKIVNALNIKILPKEMKSKDTKALAQTIISKWLPLSFAALSMVVEVIPSPIEAQQIRCKAVMYGNKDNVSYRNEEIEKAVSSCATEGVETTAFISKMVSVPTELLPGIKRVQLTIEQIKERRKQRLELESKKAEEGEEIKIEQKVEEPTDEISNEKDSNSSRPSEVFVGFGRVFSGTLKKGQDIYVLGPKYDPENPNAHISKIKIESLFLLMGRELEDLDEIPAGNIFGMLGLENDVLKFATLSTTPSCPSFGQLYMEVSPIVRVALEPKNPSQMPQLIEGLKLLNQADPCVEISIQETGEHVIATAGELHLERCMKDLQERFAKIEIEQSEPIVPFRETIVQENASEIKADQNGNTNLVTVFSSDKNIKISIRAIPLPIEISNFIEAANQIKGMSGFFVRHDDINEDETQNEADDETLYDFIKNLKDLFTSAGGKWPSYFSKVLSLGPRKFGPNVLVNNLPNIDTKCLWKGFSSRIDELIENSGNNGTQKKLEFKTSLLNGFSLATASGPLCEEPMMGVCYLLEEFEVEQTASQPSGVIISLMKEACRDSFLNCSPRLMLAIYSCEIQAETDIIGRVYGVISKRKGKILSEEMKDGTSIFVITATLPVVESFGFTTEIRSQTSGLANPQLVFSGWEIFEENPFWVPSTEEELEDLGEKSDRENIALRYMNSVRKRKGLFVHERIVESAEKQSTLRK